MASITAEAASKPDTTRLSDLPSTTATNIHTAQATLPQSRQPLEQFDIEPSSHEDPPNNAAEDESTYPNLATTMLVIGAAGIALILVSMNSMILATAIPHITDDFGTIADVGWYAAAYRLTVCAFQFMFGKMYRLWSLKRVFMMTIVIFELGSLVCALSPTSTALIIGRAIQGLGAGGLISGCFAMVSVAVPVRKRPLYSGLLCMIEESFGAIAPLIGGTITDRATWRWCFYMNLPLGALALLLIGIFFKDIKMSSDQDLPTLTKIKKLDLTGTAIFVPGIVALLFALQLGGTTFGWDDPRVITCLVLSALLVGAFAAWQIYRGEEATLPPRIVKNRTVLSGMFFAGCNNGLFTVVEYYLPIYFQTVRQSDAQTSGLLLLPCIIGFTLSTLCGGCLVSWIGYWTPVMAFTSILTPIACGLLTTLSVSSPTIRIGVYQAMLGWGSGLGFQGPQFAIQTLLSRADVPIGIAIIQFAQNFGPAIMVPAAQTLFSAQLSHDLTIEAPGVNATTLENMGLSDLRDKVQAYQLAGTLQGFDKALMQTLYLPTAVACFLIFATITMEWKSVKKTQ